MPIKNLHSKPFDDGTQTKLYLFEKYFESWLPTFLYSKFEEIYICDFFSGPGKDLDNNLGSPLIILKIIKTYKEQIKDKRFKINILLNELDKNKFDQLQEYVKTELDELTDISDKLHIEIYNSDFKVLFNSVFHKLKTIPNFIFIDQNGIKQVTNDIIIKLDSLERSDFLFFISSSYFNRFSFEEIFPNIPINKIRNNKFTDIHREILNYYKSLLGDASNTKLYPFSIKKKQNLFGLVFGSKHFRAVDKFLTAAWKTNPINGEADFDIDNDTSKAQGLLFEERQLNKIEIFKRDLERYVLSKSEIENCDIYVFTLEHGHIPKHAIEVLKSLREKKVLEHFPHTKINYDKCFGRKKETIIFRVMK